MRIKRPNQQCQSTGGSSGPKDRLQSHQVHLTVLQTYACTQHTVTGAERAKNLLSRCEKNWLEREQEVVELETEQGAGVTEIGLSDEWKFCHSDSAHMVW